MREASQSIDLYRKNPYYAPFREKTRLMEPGLKNRYQAIKQYGWLFFSAITIFYLIAVSPALLIVLRHLGHLSTVPVATCAAMMLTVFAYAIGSSVVTIALPRYVLLPMSLMLMVASITLYLNIHREQRYD